MNLENLIKKNLAHLDGKKLVFNDGAIFINEEITLANNSLTDVDFNVLESIESIDLSYNDISSIDFKNIKNLNEISLNNNSLNKINFGELTEIDTIDLTATLLEELDLRQFTKIGYIYLPKSIEKIKSNIKIDFKVDDENYTKDRTSI